MGVETASLTYVVTEALFLPKPKLGLVAELSCRRHLSQTAHNFFPPIVPVVSTVIFYFPCRSLLLPLTPFLYSSQMADSYSSSRNGDISPNGIGNGSSPSLVPTQATAPLSSVIRKKLMGYVGFANLPNQVHRKSVRKGFQFTAMVVGMLPFFFDISIMPSAFLTASFSVL